MRWSFSSAKLKTTGFSSIPLMSILDFFLLFYPCDYIRLVLFPQTNNQLAHRDVDFSEFLIFVGCWLYMDCFEGFVGGLICWSNTEVKMFEVSTVRLTKYMSLNRFEDILHNMPTLILMHLSTMKTFSTCIRKKMHGMQT